MAFFVKLHKRAKTPAERARVTSVVVPALCSLYGEYREADVLRHLVAFGDKRAVPTLVSVLGSPSSDPHSANLAARTLVDLKATEAVPELGLLVARLSRGAKSGQVLAAVQTLGQLGDRRAVPVLSKALEASYTDIRLCKKAAEALGRLGDTRAVPALESAMMATSTHQGDCYPQARVALARLSGASILRLRSTLGNPARQQQLASRHKLTGEQVTTRIVTLLGDLMASKAAPSLQRLLVTGPPRVQQAALLALGKIDDAGAQPALLRLLGHRGKANARLRIQACHALTLVGAKKAIPRLLDLADRGNLPGGYGNLRFAAARAYGLLVGAEVDTGYERVKEIWKKERTFFGKRVFKDVLDCQDLAVRCLDDPLCYGKVLADGNRDPVRRIKAAVMVATLPDGRKALPLLVRALSERDATLRRHFLWAAKRVGRPDDHSLIKTLEALVKRDSDRHTPFLGRDLASEGRVALAVISRQKAEQPRQIENQK